MVVVPSRRRPFGIYSLLGLNPNATKMEIEKKWKQWCLRSHPDKVEGGVQARGAATKKFAALNESWSILRDPEKRRLYDDKHFEQENSSESTVRVRVHRARLNKSEKEIVEAIQTAREKINNKKAFSKKDIFCRGKKKETVCEKNTSARSTKVKPGDKWVIFSRTNQERKSDKRKKKFIALPASVVERLKSESLVCL